MKFKQKYAKILCKSFCVYMCGFRVSLTTRLRQYTEDFYGTQKAQTDTFQA